MVPGRHSTEAHHGSRGVAILTAFLLSAAAAPTGAQAPTPDVTKGTVDPATPAALKGPRADRPGGRAPDHPSAVRPRAWTGLHLADPVARLAAGKALAEAWERLAEPDCSTVLDGFTDRSGRPLEQRLRELSMDLQTYLTMIIFIDGSREDMCVTGVLASTVPGSRVVRLCLDELKRSWQQDPDHAVASFIHEMLHTLGLGENPPSSSEITRRVLAVCRRR